MIRYKPEATDHLGTFEVTDDELRISDPCYSPSTWCSGILENTKQGTWNAYVVHGDTDWHHRCWELVAIHSEYPKSLACQITGKTDIVVGVDSGQAGIFSVSAYHGGTEDGGEYGSGGWYDLCCVATLKTKHSADVIEGGCVSSTGFGDGSYKCYVTRDGKAAAVGVRIVFISTMHYSEADDEEEEKEQGFNKSQLQL